MKWSKYICLVLLGSAACGTRQDTAAEQQPATTTAENQVILTDTEMQTAGITLGQPQKDTMASFLKVSGVVDVPPQNVVSISFPMGGYLAATQLLPGMKVRKGQAIATMQDQALIQLQQDYLMARSKVGFLQKDYERQKLLNTTKTTSDKVLEQTQSEYQTQRILMSSLKERLRMIHIDPASLNENTIRRSVYIYSPIDGYVSAVHVNIGKYVNPSDVLFELVNPNDLHLTLKVFERDLPLIRKGQRVKVNLVNHPEKNLEAEVSLVSKRLDNDRSAEVHCHILNATDKLLPGMFATGEIAVENKQAVTVPEEAVVRWGDAQYVFLQKQKGVFEMTGVNTGATTNGKTEIDSAKGDLLRQTIINKNAYAALMKLQNKAE